MTVPFKNISLKGVRISSDEEANCSSPRCADIFFFHEVFEEEPQSLRPAHKKSLTKPTIENNPTID
jgi:hypothetical protein